MAQKNHSERLKSAHEQILAYVKQVNDLALEMRRGKAGIINKSKPIITLDGAPVIYPNTITTIQGKTGTHKSHIAQNIVSAVIAPEGNESKTMGFKCSAPSDLVVVYIDTERNYREQFLLALQSMLANAGLRADSNPLNFAYFSFLTVPRQLRLAVLNELLKELRDFFKDKHLLVILDVMTDFVSSFNDEKECMLLIDLLNLMCNRDKASVIGIIHENPGSDKARGHLGTELGNKATTSLQTKHVNTLGDGTEVFALNFVKFRNDRKPKPVFLKYDDKVDNLVITEAQNPVAEKVNSVRRIQQALKFHLLTEVSKTKLLEKLTVDTKLSNETVSKAIGKIIKDGLEVEHLLDGPGRLTSSKNGKEVVYRIEPVLVEKTEDETEAEVNAS